MSAKKNWPAKRFSEWGRSSATSSDHLPTNQSAAWVPVHAEPLLVPARNSKISNIQDRMKTSARRAMSVPYHIRDDGLHAAALVRHQHFP